MICKIWGEMGYPEMDSYQPRSSANWAGCSERSEIGTRKFLCTGWGGRGAAEGVKVLACVYCVSRPLCSLGLKLKVSMCVHVCAQGRLYHIIIIIQAWRRRKKSRAVRQLRHKSYIKIKTFHGTLRPDMTEFCENTSIFMWLKTSKMFKNVTD